MDFPSPSCYVTNPVCQTRHAIDTCRTRDRMYLLHCIGLNVRLAIRLGTRSGAGAGAGAGVQLNPSVTTTQPKKSGLQTCRACWSLYLASSVSVGPSHRSPLIDMEIVFNPRRSDKDHQSEHDVHCEQLYSRGTPSPSTLHMSRLDQLRLVSCCDLDGRTPTVGTHLSYVPETKTRSLCRAPRFSVAEEVG